MRSASVLMGITPPVHCATSGPTAGQASTPTPNPLPPVTVAVHHVQLEGVSSRSNLALTTLSTVSAHHAQFFYSAPHTSPLPLSLAKFAFNVIAAVLLTTPWCDSKPAGFAAASSRLRATSRPPVLCAPLAVSSHPGVRPCALPVLALHTRTPQARPLARPALPATTASVPPRRRDASLGTTALDPAPAQHANRARNRQALVRHHVKTAAPMNGRTRGGRLPASLALLAITGPARLGRNCAPGATSALAAV